jgi:hypothetical protein
LACVSDSRCRKSLIRVPSSRVNCAKDCWLRVTLPTR